MYFYAIDGDDIGSKLEKFALLGELESIKMLSEEVYEFLVHLKTYFEENSATIVFCGGDSLLAYSKHEIELNLERLSLGNLTFSAGIGANCRDATLALKKAKGLGKRRIEVIL